MLLVGAIAIDFAFRSLLVDQARGAIARTAENLARTVQADAAYSFGDVGSLLLDISDRATLDHFASTNEFVQIDGLDGTVLGKSSNLGGYIFAPPRDGRFRPGFRVVRAAGEPPSTMLVLTRVLTDPQGRPLAVAFVGGRLQYVDELIERARTILVVVTLGALLAIVLASYLIAGMAITPIQRLTAAVAEIGSERLDRRLRWKRRDELGRLATAFDAMLDRLQSAFARERQFISDASHELRTPLTVINANAQLLRRWGDADPQVRDESIAAIDDESRRLAGMVSGMLTLAKAESGDAIPKEPLVLERLVDEVVERARERAEAKALALAAHHPAGASTIVVGDAGLLRQLVGNLVDNAIKFTREGAIDVSVRREDGRAIVDVADTGPGIEATTADRLFDRFFRGDPAHARTVEGTGLGLAIVRSIAHVHGGTVAAEPRPEGGSLFRVSLPAEPESLTGGS